jgi:hypothetical protein
VRLIASVTSERAYFCPSNIASNTASSKRNGRTPGPNTRASAVSTSAGEYTP